MDQARPHAWRYREWVIDAINADYPFDRFTVDQIAGDLLPNPKLEQVVATGFHRNATKNTESGSDPVEDYARRTIDRTNTYATVWLGLTMGCCQCHDHKYEDISQEEYYQLYAFFNGVSEPKVNAPTKHAIAVFEELADDFTKAHEPLTQARDIYLSKELPKRCVNWERSLTKLEQAVFNTLHPTEAVARGGEATTIRKDGSVLISGTLPDEGLYIVKGVSRLSKLTALRLDVLADASLPNGGPGRASNGDFDLNSISVEVKPLGPNGAPFAQDVKLVAPAASYSADGGDVRQVLSASESDAYGYLAGKGWSIAPRFGEDHFAVFEFAQPIHCPHGAEVTVRLRQGKSAWMTNIGCFKLALTDAATPFVTEGLDNSVATTLTIPVQDRTLEQTQQIRGYYLTRDDTYAALNRSIQGHLSQAPKDPFRTRARIITPPKQPITTRVFENGDFLQLGSTVRPNTPNILPALNARGEQADRLDLANWTVRKDNPLAARVAVNRIWQHYFGSSLVATDHDFGTHGEDPSHPELLDWLASELIRSNWSCKSIHRLIVTSKTYQQSSHFRPELAELDPYNRLVARQNRVQVDAEIVRDAALFAAGILNTKMRGPSVVLAQPSGRDELAFSHSTSLRPTRGPDALRRSVYVWFQRTSPHPMLNTFDAPNANAACTRRHRSTTAVQALTRLNHPTFLGCSLAIGKNLFDSTQDSQSPPSANSRLTAIDSLFVTCLSRSPNSNEYKAIEELLNESLDYYLAHPQEAGRFAAALRANVHSEKAACELAAWVVVARTVLNVEEFITRD